MDRDDEVIIGLVFFDVCLENGWDVMWWFGDGDWWYFYGFWV